MRSSSSVALGYFSFSKGTIDFFQLASIMAMCAKTENAFDESGQMKITNIVTNRVFLNTVRLTGLAKSL